MIKSGATLGQVKAAAKVAADYDTRYVGASGPWTTDIFMGAVYASLEQTSARNAAQK